MEIPPIILDRVWGIPLPESAQFGMMWDASEQVMTVNDETDGRASPDFIAASFSCNDSGCPHFCEEHCHVFNIDPRYRHIPVHHETAQALIDNGFVCMQQDCEWRQDLHFHLTKNE